MIPDEPTTDPTRSRPYTSKELARLLAAAGRYDAARDPCEAGLTAVSRSADLNALLGLACLALGEFDLAESAYARAVGIGIDPAQPVLRSRCCSSSADGGGPAPPSARR